MRTEDSMKNETREDRVIGSMPFAALVRNNVDGNWRVNHVHVHRFFDPEIGPSFGIETHRDVRLVEILDRNVKAACSMLDKVGSGELMNASVETAMLGKLTLWGKNVPPFDNERAHLLTASVWEKDIWFKLCDGVPEAISSAIKNCIANEELLTSV